MNSFPMKVRIISGILGKLYEMVLGSYVTVNKSSTMSEINDLKKQILQKLEGINDRYQLRTIHKMMDRVDEIEKCLKNKEHSLTRGQNASFFREEIDMSLLSGAAAGLGDLVTQALDKMEEMESRLS